LHGDGTVEGFHTTTLMRITIILKVLCIEVYSYVESPNIFYLQNLLRIIFNRALGLTFDILRKQIFLAEGYC
jgi:hypothetical protein